MSQTPSICLLRLSALGDATHVVPVVRTLQRQLPGCRLTWVIGPGEAKLLAGLEDVRFVVYDKRSGLSGMRALWRELRKEPFDVLLQMQLAARANLLAAGIRARRRIGYDRARSKEGHGLVVNERIDPGGQHVLDVLGRFCEPLGVRQDRVEWNLPLAAAEREWAAGHLAPGRRWLLVSPCSSHRLRNWSAERYAAVADHAVSRGWSVAICGGRSELERVTTDAILAAMSQPALDLVGRDTLKQLIALLERADAVMAPDSGPVHIANAVGTPVLGLYACTDPTRSGPYSSLEWTIDRYDAAARRFLGKPGSALRWGKRVEFEGAMDLIAVEEVIERFDAFAATQAPLPAP
ncbi:glycosyltransferase family 9 protein [Alkalisalibacterium limincola]|uniref:glycosyltransferase family 9 protein n=1 Tax=Alkalisalibacterium limincola TaxID=2699169 RepID=UPI002107F7BA|nr:glycosyltransferase family 9 protein [Alkalisalibacterium limincola]